MSNNTDKSRGLGFKGYQDPKEIERWSRSAHRQMMELKKAEEKRKAFEAWKKAILENPTAVLTDESKKELEGFLDKMYEQGAIRFSKHITLEQEILNE